MRNAVNEFGVRFLVHFTQASNLSSILEHGILPKTDLQESFFPFEWNDQYRYDGFQNASCFSIGMPNYRMFYKYRQENPNTDWVVLGIKKEALWEKDCAFCKDNAASNQMTQTTIESRKGVKAFRELYDEFPNKPTRKALAIDSSLPTNPQSEVLIFEKVDPEYIFAVAFEQLAVLNRYKQFVPSDVKVEVQKWLYEPRPDYEHWR